MDQRAEQRQSEIRALIDSDTLTLEQARAALHGLLDVTASAQAGPDVTSYGFGMDLPREVVDAEYAAREAVGYEMDEHLVRSLRSAAAQRP
ncbi:hypothetical protein OG883_44245 [Streptomyces sp. NBC_01142]|uniref:hypothetical protein n=1 Tax=Streptomyces sp. NBC_01142 TaxID=2975865 RepID=UPI002253449F|nr:hypothetical protein [Streptomyces sp. NBC_01142]MCX4826655.1 hypothetical protein [Streptomyces sp. NBC_01142]